MSEQIVKGAGNYAEARCILPGCGQPLHITWTASRAIYLSDTDDSLRDPGSAHATTWHVECEAGHIVLLPPDDGDDYHEFAGPCVCNPDYPDKDREPMCAHNDMNRLRAVVLPEPPKAGTP